MRGAIGVGLIFLIAAASPAVAQTAKFLQKFGDWSAYVNDTPGKKVCFVVSRPKSKKPKKVKRGPIYFYVSHWPADKVRNEISVKMGYPLKARTIVEVKIGEDRFKLFIKAEGAYVKSADKEKAIVGKMKKGSLMIVQGRSKRGTLTTDQYSLSGVADALDRIAQDCPEG